MTATVFGMKISFRFLFLEKHSTPIIAAGVPSISAGIFTASSFPKYFISLMADMYSTIINYSFL